MIQHNLEVFELDKSSDPRFEGFALDGAASILGRESLDDDLTPGFGEANKNQAWQQPRLKAQWIPPSARGRVAEFNDYPCVDLVIPAFSERAVECLSKFLKPNGEVLPLKTATKMKYFVFNILTISDALDQEKSQCNFWRDPPTTTKKIDFFEFDIEKVRELSIFRIKQMPISVFVTSDFVEKVAISGLKGFSFTKVWPYPPGVNWKTQAETNSNQLKENTVVLVLPTTDVKIGDRINEFEKEIDSHLSQVALDQEYFGVYEGHDQLSHEYRMFFSCPDADKLLDRLRGKVKELNWPAAITAYRRYGNMHEPNAKEVQDKI